MSQEEDLALFGLLRSLEDLLKEKHRDNPPLMLLMKELRELVSSADFVKALYIADELEEFMDLGAVK